MFSFSAPLAPFAAKRPLQPRTVRGWWVALILPLTAILLATSMGVAAGKMFDLRPDRPQHPKLHFRLFDLLSLDSTPSPQKKGLIRIDQDGSVTEGQENPIPNMKIPNQDFHVALPREITGKDGGPMVLVPAGIFTMGSPEGTGEPDERPQHKVYLNNYHIDQYEVTVERYHHFLKVKNRGAPKYWDQVELSRDGQKAVVRINWKDARAYCQWAGKRLPTEAEWEKAARGLDKRTYPWGETTPNFSTANLGKTYEPRKAYAEKLRDVGSYERGISPYGAYDMAGNVWEWVADWYDQDYYQVSPNKNPQGPSSGNFKVRRGGSWGNDPTALRSALRGRFLPARRSAAIGFRCAQDAP